MPGHVHLKDLGQLVAREIEKAGGVAKEFNTIAVDDGIAMGHDGMLYSLPSREIIADSVEYMVNAHCADAIVCISNCDKITPGMLMAALRLNIPVVFVSGGPMEAGKTKLASHGLDLVDAMVVAADDSCSDEKVAEYERSACPTCGSCSGMFTANSMNCLTEALGLSLPGNGSTLATHADREQLFLRAGRLAVELCQRYYGEGDDSVLPRNIANFKAFENAMTLDIAMGGSTNTILHLLAAAQEAEVPFDLRDIDRLSRKVPQLCKVAPNIQKYHMEDVHRAGGIFSILGELARGGLLHTDVPTVHSPSMADAIAQWDITQTRDEAVHTFFKAGPAGIPTQTAFSQNTRWPSLDDDRAEGCIRSIEHAYSKEGGLAVLYGNIALDGCVVKTAGVDESIHVFEGSAKIFESQDAAVKGILGDEVKAGDIVIIPLRRTEGRAGHAGNALSDQLPEVQGPGQAVRPAHRRTLLRRHLGPVHRPRLPGSRRRRRHRPGAGRRQGADRHSQSLDQPAGQRRRTRRTPRRTGQEGLEAGRAACPPRQHRAQGLRPARHQRRQGRGTQQGAAGRLNRPATKKARSRAGLFHSRVRAPNGG